MTPAEYRARNNARARGSNPTLQPEQSRLALYALGLAGEAGELAEALLMESTQPLFLKTVTAELGDVVWYFDRLAQVYGLIVSEDEVAPEKFLNAPPVMVSIGLICDLIKKELFHDKANNETTMRAVLNNVLLSLHRVMYQHGLSIFDVMEANTAKLDARHPNGWDPSYHQKDK